LLEKAKSDQTINVDHLRNIFSSLENIMPLNKKLLQRKFFDDEDPRQFLNIKTL